MTLGSEVITCPNPACRKRIVVFVEEELNECQHCGAEITDLKYKGEGIIFSYHQPIEDETKTKEEFPIDPEWEAHLEICDGCPSCNPTAFRD